MLLRSTYLILVVAIAYTNCELEDDAYEEGSKELSRSYRYNHPPLFELSDALKGILTIDENNRNKRDVPEAPVIEFKESLSPEKIPVSIEYDEGTGRDSQEQKNSTVTKVKRRKHRKNRPSANKESKIVKPEEVKSVTNRESVTESTPVPPVTPRTVVPKTFTKRPPEDNPVFKKIRQREPVVKILDEKNYVFSHSGNFHYSYEGGDGTKISSQGELKTINNDTTGEAVVGNVFYTDKDGNDFNLSYTADENGYRPTGAHLPTPPPIPPAIARALKYLATATTPEPVTKPSKKKSKESIE